MGFAAPGAEVIPSPEPRYPPDLQISWSWPHFIVFVVFSVVSFALVQLVLALHYAPHQTLLPKEFEQYLLSKPGFIIGSMLIGYGLIFFFLYVTLALLRGQPFWRSLGWRKIEPNSPQLPRSPLPYFFLGCALSLAVMVVTLAVKPPENAPIEELFKHKNTALVFMAMAVLLAPLVEETLFRGYIYPLFARTFGIGIGIVGTGILFGLLHAEQLGKAWSMVSILMIVGAVFTLVRARTGSVFASYMMHLGYNSFIAIIEIVGTHGFTKFPTS